MVAVIRPSPTEVESWRELEDMLDAWEIPLCRSGLGISGFGCATRKTSPLQEGARSPQGARSPTSPRGPQRPRGDGVEQQHRVFTTVGMQTFPFALRR